MGRDKRKDQITGLKIDMLHPNGEIYRFKDDVVYLVEDTDTPTNFEVLHPMSYIPTKSPPLGKMYFQAQLSSKELIATSFYSDGNVARTVHKGRAKFNKKGHLKTFKNRIMGYMDWWADRDAFFGSVEVYSPAHKFLPNKRKGGFADFPEGKEVAYLSMTGHDAHTTPDGEPAYWTTREHGKGLSYFQNLGDGKYFFEGWHLDPFDTSLI